jgi:branched-chain amino acid transport system substrate-binding protein
MRVEAAGHLLVCCLALSGCTSRSPHSPVVLGHVATLSGPNRETGEAAARGIRLAVAEINKDLDEDNGLRFVVIHSNANGSLDRFEAEAVRLTTINHVPILIGGATAEEVERLERAHVPVVTPLGSSGRGKRVGVFYTGLALRQQGKVLAQFAAQELGAARLLLIQDDRCEESQDIADALIHEFAAVWAKKDPASSSVVRRVPLKDAKAWQMPAPTENDGPQAIVFCGKADDLRQLGPLPLPVLVAGEPGSEPLPNNISTELYCVTPFAIDPDSPRAMDVTRRYQQAFHEEPNAHAALAYEGLMLLHEAISRTKDNLSMSRVREELAKIGGFSSLHGVLSFDSEQQLRRPAFVIRVDSSGSKIVKRYDPDAEIK